SPQGAMMLWYSPTVGTTIPRGIRGRATGVNDADQPVEIQCFYTPDPRRSAPGKPGHDQLELLRPAESKHARLVILPPVDVDDGDDEDDEDDDENPTPRRRGNDLSLFRRTVSAPWGLAIDHPEHDPVHRRAQLVSARAANSEPYTLLGLADVVG